MEVADEAGVVHFQPIVRQRVCSHCFSSLACPVLRHQFNPWSDHVEAMVQTADMGMGR